MNDTAPAVQRAILLFIFAILMGSIGHNHSNTAPVVGYSQSNSIELHDAFGRRLVLPFALCGTYEVGFPLSRWDMLMPPQGFHATLVNLFSRTDGHWFVNARRYTIIKANKYSPLSYWNWQSVKPGMKLMMYIDLDQVACADQYRVCVVCRWRAPRDPSNKYQWLAFI